MLRAESLNFMTYSPYYLTGALLYFDSSVQVGGLSILAAAAHSWRRLVTPSMS